MNALMLDTVKLSENREYLEILDQTLLPKTVKVLNIGKLEDIWEAIKVLRVRGAPAIGVTAALVIDLCSSKLETKDINEFEK